MSEASESSATPGADETALVPDGATVVHPTGGEPTGTESAPAPASAPAWTPPAPAPSSAPAWTPPAPPQESAGTSGPAALATERPEVAVGAAFAGGLVLALILKRLAR